MVGIHLHNVPQNGLSADLDHRLWARRGFFAKPGAETPGENDRFHDVPFWVSFACACAE